MPWTPQMPPLSPDAQARLRERIPSEQELIARRDAALHELHANPPSVHKAPAVRHASAPPAGYRTDGPEERTDAAPRSEAEMRQRAHDDLRQTFARSRGVDVAAAARTARGQR